MTKIQMSESEYNAVYPEIVDLFNYTCYFCTALKGEACITANGVEIRYLNSHKSRRDQVVAANIEFREKYEVVADKFEDLK